MKHAGRERETVAVKETDRAMKAESVSNLGDDTTGTTLVAVHSPPIAMIGNTEYPGKSCNLNPGLKIQGTQIRTDNSN